MSDFYTRPGFYNVQQLLNLISRALYNEDINIESAIGKRNIIKSDVGVSKDATRYSILDYLPYEKIEELEKQIRNGQLVKKITVKRIQCDIEARSKHHSISTPENEVLQDIPKLTALIKIWKVWKALRDALCNNSLKIYIDYSGEILSINSYFGNGSWDKQEKNWTGDKAFYRLLADGCVYTNGQGNINGNIINIKGIYPAYLKKEEGDTFLSRLCSDVSQQNILTFDLNNRRAAIKLFLIMLNHIDHKPELLEGKKNTFQEVLKQQAIDHGFYILDNVQKDFGKKSKNDQQMNDDNSVSKKDIESITTIIRNLASQKGNRNKK